ncbi:MAG: dockerin type I domain-containing protein, partial [Planctomycetota bacterium]
SSFAGGQIIVQLVSGANTEQGDRLSFVPSLAGYSLEGQQILFNEEAIAELSLESVDEFLEIEMLDADIARASDLARQIVFEQQYGSVDERQRIVSLQAIDPDGNSSSSIYQPIFYAQQSFMRKPGIRFVPESTTSLRLGSTGVVSQDSEEYSYESSDPRFFVEDAELHFEGELDYETERSIVLVIAASDSQGQVISTIHKFGILNQNDPPDALSIDNSNVWQEVLGQTVGRLEVSDADVGQAHTFESLDSLFEIVDNHLQFVEDSGLAAGTESHSLQIRATDSGSPPMSTVFDIVLTAHAVDSPWQNQAMPMDVSGDLNVSALDALYVIDYLNSGQPLSLEEAGILPGADGPFLDVTGDRFVVALDALILISELNSRGSAEGEGFDASTSDSLFVDLVGFEQDRKRWFHFEA